MKDEIVRLLKECSESLYYVYKAGDPKRFNLDHYRDLAYRCLSIIDILSEEQKVMNTLVQEALEDL